MECRFEGRPYDSAVHSLSHLYLCATKCTHILASVFMYIVLPFVVTVDKLSLNVRYWIPLSPLPSIISFPSTRSFLICKHLPLATAPFFSLLSGLLLFPFSLECTQSGFSSYLFTETLMSNNLHFVKFSTRIL